MHGVCSSYSELRAGLPQGSILGPPLFNIFINDLNYKVPDVSLRLYADDATLYASDVSPIALQVVVVSQGLSRLSVRCKLFVDKQFQDASPSDRSLQDFDLTLNGSGVTKLPSIRIFGVEPDSMLNFIEHISIQLKEAYAKTSALRRIRHFVPMDVMLALYKSFILPHPEYCSPLLLGVGKSRPVKLKTPIIIC